MTDDDTACEDVPALLAEIGRLRAALVQADRALGNIAPLARDGFNAVDEALRRD